MKRPTTTSRKRDHVELTVKKDVSFKVKTSGFEEWEFVHNALPEINLSEIDTTTTFFGKKLSFPFLISCMTGGYPEAETINLQLAEVCEEYHLAMGVGSQRQAMENKAYHRSFSIARKSAPSIPLIGNIGAPEVAALKDISSIQKLADLIGADAFAVHLNPLQEFLQPEGNTNFRGVLNGIEKLVKGLSIPVIVKEIGAGISFDVANRLTDVGVRTIDVAGAGGTSWAGVEILRRKDNCEVDRNPFWDWGIRTTDALQEVVPLKKNILPDMTIISSGGISNGVEIAKSIALGADMTASARPMLKALMNGRRLDSSSGKKELRKKIDQMMMEFKGTMFLIGVSSIGKLQFSKALHRKN